MKNSINRLNTINKRIQTLTELNAVNNYTQMILTKKGLVTNPKCDQYLSLLYLLKFQKRKIEIENRKENPIYQNQLKNAKRALPFLIGSSMFNAVEINN